MSINYLIKSLLSFFKFAFWLSVLILVNSLAREVFTKDGKIGPTSSTHHSNGYEIPVQLQLTVYDSIVTYDKKGYNHTVNYRKGMLHEYYGSAISKQDSLRKLKDVTKQIRENEIFIRSNDNPNGIEIMDYKIVSDAMLKVKSSTTWLNALLFVNGYIGIILTIIMFYFLKAIFKILKKDINFSAELSKKVRTLGAIFVLGVLFKLLLSIVFYTQYDVITVQSAINDVKILNPTYLLIYPRLNVKFGILLIGLSLIILSTLLKRGNRIQQENDLTI